MLIIAQDTRRSSRATRKGKETTAHEREPFNESPGGDGSEENSMDEYIKKLQAELAELKAAHGIASSSHTVRHKERGEKGCSKQGARRYEIVVMSQEAGICYLFK